MPSPDKRRRIDDNDDSDDSQDQRITSNELQVPNFHFELQAEDDSTQEIPTRQLNVSLESFYDKDEDSLLLRLQAHQSKFCQRNESTEQPHNSSVSYDNSVFNTSCSLDNPAKLQPQSEAEGDSCDSQGGDSLLMRLNAHKLDMVRSENTVSLDHNYSCSADRSLSTCTVMKYQQEVFRFPRKRYVNSLFSTGILMDDSESIKSVVEDKNISDSEDEPLEMSRNECLATRVANHFKDASIMDLSWDENLPSRVEEHLKLHKSEADIDKENTESQQMAHDDPNMVQTLLNANKINLCEADEPNMCCISTPERDDTHFLDFIAQLSPINSEPDSPCSTDTENEMSDSSESQNSSILFNQNNNSYEKSCDSSDDEDSHLTTRTSKSKLFIEKAKLWNTTPLFDGSPLTVNDGILSIMELHLENVESKSSLARLLQTVSNLLPEKHNLPSTAHLILQYIEGLAPDLFVTSHYYCKSCLIYRIEVDDNHCAICQKDTETGTFYCLNIKEVVKYWLEERNLASLMETPITNCENGSVRDIQDGSVYKSLNVNRGKYDINLVLGSDGVVIRKGCKKELWLLMATPVEAPIHLRESFTTVVGIWYDTQKPKNMNAFFKPFSEEMKAIHDNNGVEWTHPQTKAVNKSQVKAPLVIADAPARAKVQNLMQHNSINGCNICEISTVKSAVIPDKKTIRFYKYRHNLVMRTKERMYLQATQATQTGIPVKGVKGASVLSIIPTFDIATCCIPEFMHSTLLGVTRQLILLWIQKRGPWNIKESVFEIDASLANILHPDFVHRTSRLLKYLKSWKASDFYYFLLFECLPVLHNILPEIYFQHLILFVSAMYTLLKRNISHGEIEEADIFLKLFVSQFERLYGDRAMTYNVHQLCHLALSVERFGPLHCNSAFPFEGMNGTIARGTHGTNNVAQEIVNNLKIYQGVQRLRNISQGVDSNLPHQNFCNGTVLGKPTDINLDPTESALFDSANVHFFSRAKLGFEIFTSEIHKKLKTSNHFVMWQRNSVTNYGSIRFFAMVNNTFHVCVKVFNINHLNVFYHTQTIKTVGHLIPIHVNSNNIVVVNEENELGSFVKVGRVKDFRFVRPHLLHQVL